jgi:hypothetical protein
VGCNRGYIRTVQQSAESTCGQWVLLSYRLPREPSTPRIALWRRLRRLGVAQISDGLVALPADARTREQVEWAAEQIVEAAGVSSVWLAQPSTLAQERLLAEGMAAARAEEYTAVCDAAAAAMALPRSEQVRALCRLRSSLREITRRDFFPPAVRDQASAAVQGLAVVISGGDPVLAAGTGPARRVSR